MYKNLKQIPLGINSFQEISEKETYFVDKSMLIKEIVDNVSKVYSTS